MKAIILAAGLGSRLKDITKLKPKALVEVNGVTMLERVIVKLASQGVKDFLINIHHKGEDIVNFLAKNNNFSLNITISDERSMLLNTGGAILKAKDFIAGDEPILVHNVDIISDIDINRLQEFHIGNNCMASLCVRERDTARYLLFNKQLDLVGWTNSKLNTFKWVSNEVNDYIKLAFSGIYMISPEFVDKIEQVGEFSIIDAWLDIAKDSNIKYYLDDTNTWHDLGTKERIQDAEK